MNRSIRLESCILGLNMFPFSMGDRFVISGNRDRWPIAGDLHRIALHCSSSTTSPLLRICQINRIECNSRLTVVLIHIRAATLAPIATAPAVPPRMADFADLFIISENVGAGFFVSSDMVELLFELFGVYFMERIDVKCFRCMQTLLIVWTFKDV